MRSPLTLFFARRYLFARKSHSVINIIAGVSSVAVAIPVMAMVILLSVFNGFEGMIKQMHQSFDPDLEVQPRSGKVFVMDSLPVKQIEALKGVAAVSFVLQENALFEYRDRQYLGIMRGVDANYTQVVPLDSLVCEGHYRLQHGQMEEALVGQGVAYALGLRTSFNDPLTLYTPRRGEISPLLPTSFYHRESLFPSGIFVLDAEMDGQYVVVSLPLAQRLLDYPARASALTIRLARGASSQATQSALVSLLGEEYTVVSREQQRGAFYRIMSYEKWGIYFILLLVLLVASFSLVGSLVMLIIDKRKDMQTLTTMGASVPLLRRIFFTEGMLIYGLGAVMGMVLGLLISLGQQHFGWVAIGAESFLVDAYPVEVRLLDLLWVLLTCSGVSVLIALGTVHTMIPRSHIYTQTS